MKKVFFLITCAMCINATNTQAQTANTNKIIVYYPFDGIKSVNEATILDTEIKKMKNVTDSKTEYKTGKANGQLQVWVTYDANAKESDVEFSTVMLKKLLMEKGYNPHQPKEVKNTTEIDNSNNTK